MPKFLLLVYTDTALMNALPDGRFAGMMRDCFAHADELTQEGKLLGYQQLEGPETARSVRIRSGRLSTLDGPFAESKEVLGGFNLIEAEDMDEAVRMAAEFPWAQTGCIEVRPVRDTDIVRRQVGAAAAPTVLSTDYTD
jgi:hypothetical protein